jgi:TetR/AcrR family fatty acid metabolism transcriptional regulator
MFIMAAQKKSQIRKEQILKAAEHIFARKGFQEATISDVAREAGISDATIYEYFQSKEDLLFSIPGETARSGKENLAFHLNYIRGAANKIRSIIHHFAWFYENHPDYASVAMLILKQNRKFLETDAYQDVRELSRIILDVIQEGIDSGEFRPDCNPYLIRSVILGTIEHLVIRSILLGKPKNLTELVDPLTDLIMEGIVDEREKAGWNLNITLTPGKEARVETKPSSKKTKKR